MKRFLVPLLVLLAWPELNAAANPQVSFDGETLSVEMRDVELAQALKAVGRETGVAFQVGTGIGGRLTKRFRDLPLDRALGRLLSDYSHVLLFSAEDDPPRVDRVLILPEGSQQTVLPPPELEPEYLEPEYMEPEYLEPEDSLFQDSDTLDAEGEPPIPAYEDLSEDLPVEGDDLWLEMVSPDLSQVLLQRHPSGHFIEEGSINGRPVRFLVDTGATTVAMSSSLAVKLGLSRGAQRSVSTAGGQSVGFETRLAKIELGPLALRNVDAIVLPAMEGGYVLLGMSFLAQFELLQRHDTLVIRSLR